MSVCLASVGDWLLFFTYFWQQRFYKSCLSYFNLLVSTTVIAIIGRDDPSWHVEMHNGNEAMRTDSEIQEMQLVEGFKNTRKPCGFF